MIRYLSTLLIGGLFFLSSYGYAQINSVQEKFDLNTQITESSGLIYLNNKLITHNDSGNANALYEMETTSNNITRTISISNASNIDWEDIAQDNDYIYIGDFGNNSGNRTNLKVYKILKTDYLANNSVSAEKIEFSYADQTSFTSNYQNTEFDAEAIIALDNNLLIFTKDWVNLKTKVYSVPNVSGSYSSSPIETYNVNGLITGATYSKEDKRLVLSGYNNFLSPFVWICENFEAVNTGCSNSNKINLSTDMGSFRQIEGITHANPSTYYITSEYLSLYDGFITSKAKLYELDFTPANLGVNDAKLQSNNFIYPNPATNFIYLKHPVLKSEIFDTTGKLVISNGKSQAINISNLKSGIYFINILNESGETIQQKFIKK